MKDTSDHLKECKTLHVELLTTSMNTTAYQIKETQGAEFGYEAEQVRKIFETVLNEYVNCKQNEQKFSISDIYMIRGNGYGQYAIKVAFKVYGEQFTKSFHTTDSQLWDNDSKTKEDLLSHIGGEQAILDTI